MGICADTIVQYLNAGLIDEFSHRWRRSCSVEGPVSSMESAGIGSPSQISEVIHSPLVTHFGYRAARIERALRFRAGLRRRRSRRRRGGA